MARRRQKKKTEKQEGRDREGSYPDCEVLFFETCVSLRLLASHYSRLVVWKCWWTTAIHPFYSVYEFWVSYPKYKAMICLGIDHEIYLIYLMNKELIKFTSCCFNYRDELSVNVSFFLPFLSLLYAFAIL